MQAYRFRQEEKPKFNITFSGALAVLALLLLLLLVEKTRPFELSATEVARLEALAAVQQREMTFRFNESPEDEVEVKDPRFVSDQNNIQKSEQTDAPEEDADPFSRGDTYDLKNQKRESPAVVQQQSPALSQPEVQPSQEAAQKEEAQSAEEETSPQEEVAEALADEPMDPAEEEAEEATKEALRTVDRGNVPTDPGAPKPYRKLTRQELKTASKAAMREMNLRESARVADAGTSDASTFDNPRGSQAMALGMSVECSRDDMGAYMKVLKQLIKGNWRIPNIARFEVSGVTGITFRIHQDGTFTSATIIHESQHDPLDVAAMNAVKNTHPAPPLPPHVDDEFVTVKFGFYYNMRPRYR